MAVEGTTDPPQPRLPHYPQMIMAAIEGINMREAANESAISKYIESNYPDLPDAHSTLLSNTLEKMKLTGQLLFANDGYLKPEPTGKVKRGRGRPPKPKVLLPPGVVSPPPRPRGRPPKVRDALAPSAQPKMKVSRGSGRPRGRPRKYPVVTPEAAAAAVVTLAAGGVKRGRGRPPKAKA